MTASYCDSAGDTELRCGERERARVRVARGLLNVHSGVVFLSALLVRSHGRSAIIVDATCLLGGD
jgi:hypothetical protein